MGEKEAATDACPDCTVVHPDGKCATECTCRIRIMNDEYRMTPDEIGVILWYNQEIPHETHTHPLSRLSARFHRGIDHDGGPVGHVFAALDDLHTVIAPDRANREFFGVVFASGGTATGYG